jgi:hypothetical protein
MVQSREFSAGRDGQTKRTAAIRLDHKARKSLREIANAHGVGHMTVARIAKGRTGGCRS